MLFKLGVLSVKYKLLNVELTYSKFVPDKWLIVPYILDTLDEEIFGTYNVYPIYTSFAILAPPAIVKPPPLVILVAFSITSIDIPP